MRPEALFVAEGWDVVPRVFLLLGALLYFTVASGMWNPIPAMARSVSIRLWWLTPVVLLVAAASGLVLALPEPVPSVVSFVALVTVLFAFRMHPSEPNQGFESGDAGSHVAAPLDTNRARRLFACAFAALVLVAALSI